MMQIDLPACRALRGRNKHSSRTNCARTQTRSTQSADVWEGQDDLICDCGADEDRGGGTGGGGEVSELKVEPFLSSAG